MNLPSGHGLVNRSLADHSVVLRCKTRNRKPIKCRVPRAESELRQIWQIAGLKNSCSDKVEYFEIKGNRKDRVWMQLCWLHTILHHISVATFEGYTWRSCALPVTQVGRSSPWADREDHSQFLRLHLLFSFVKNVHFEKHCCFSEHIFGVWLWKRLIDVVAYALPADSTYQLNVLGHDCDALKQGFPNFSKQCSRSAFQQTSMYL